MTGIPSLPSSVLNVEELALLGNKSGATRLGFAVLLKFFQKGARFPAYKNEVPGVVITYLATQARVPAEAYLQYLNYAGGQAIWGSLPSSISIVKATGLTMGFTPFNRL